jgi:hypothetical protein
MSVPVFLLRKCLVDAIVKVLVVGENDMAAYIVQLDDVSKVGLNQKPWRLGGNLRSLLE